MLASKLTVKTALSCQILTASRRPRWIQKPQPAAACCSESSGDWAQGCCSTNHCCSKPLKQFRSSSQPDYQWATTDRNPGAGIGQGADRESEAESLWCWAAETLWHWARTHTSLGNFCKTEPHDFKAETPTGHLAPEPSPITGRSESFRIRSRNAWSLGVAVGTFLSGFFWGQVLGWNLGARCLKLPSRAQKLAISK